MSTTQGEQYIALTPILQLVSRQHGSQSLVFWNVQRIPAIHRCSVPPQVNPDPNVGKQSVLLSIPALLIRFSFMIMKENCRTQLDTSEALIPVPTSAGEIIRTHI